jgi:type II secretory pathway component PulF
VAGDTRGVSSLSTILHSLRPGERLALAVIAASAALSALFRLVVAPSLEASYRDFGQQLPRLDQLALTTSLPVTLGALPVLVAAVALHPRVAPRRRFLIGLAVVLTGVAIGICARAWMDAPPAR